MLITGEGGHVVSLLCLLLSVWAKRVLDLRASTVAHALLHVAHMHFVRVLCLPTKSSKCLTTLLTFKMSTSNHMELVVMKRAHVV